MFDGMPCGYPLKPLEEWSIRHYSAIAALWPFGSYVRQGSSAASVTESGRREFAGELSELGRSGMRSGNPFSASPYAGSGPSQGGYPGAGSDPFGWGFPFGGYTTRQSRRTQSRSYNPRAGSDVVYDLTVEADVAKVGTRRGVTYQRYDACGVCHGLHLRGGRRPDPLPQRRVARPRCRDRRHQPRVRAPR